MIIRVVWHCNEIKGNKQDKDENFDEKDFMNKKQKLYFSLWDQYFAVLSVLDPVLKLGICSRFCNLFKIISSTIILYLFYFPKKEAFTISL